MKLTNSDESNLKSQGRTVHGSKENIASSEEKPQLLKSSRSYYWSKFQNLHYHLGIFKICLMTRIFCENRPFFR